MGLNKQTRKELKIKKLVGKAAEIHKQNVAYGKEGTQKGINKMVSGGEHYAHLVSRIRRLDPTGGVSGYKMTPGSKETNTPTNFSSGDKAIDYSTSISNFSNKINTLKTERGNVSENFIKVGTTNPFSGTGSISTAANLYHSGDFKGAAKTLKKAAFSGTSYGPHTAEYKFLASSNMPSELLHGGAESSHLSKKQIRTAYRDYVKNI